MTKVISLINMKGGVGKTTLTVALAEFMAIHKRRVLVIDLDPQANATACLMDLQQWRRKSMRGQTIMRLFLDSFQDRPIFSPQETLVRNVSNIGGGIEGLDLIPSGRELMELQDSLLTAYPDEAGRQQAVFLLGNALYDILADYDIVLIDCPPSLGLITQNGLAISDYYLIPFIPETLSLLGIPQIINRVNRFRLQTGAGLKLLGLVATRYQEKNREHAINLNDLRAGQGKKGYQRVFDNVIHETIQAANTMDFDQPPPATLHKKYGSGRLFKEYEQLTMEVLRYSGEQVQPGDG